MTALHNEIICFQDGKVVAIQCIDNWTLKQINEFMAIQQEFYPERDCRLKRNLKNERQANETSK